VPRIAAISLILVSLLAGGVTLALAGSGRARGRIHRTSAGIASGDKQHKS